MNDIEEPAIEYLDKLNVEAADEGEVKALKAISDFLVGNEDLKREGRTAKLRYKRAQLVIPNLGENDRFDLVAMPHNVLRREMERLYNMVEFYRKYPGQATCEHTKMFFEWWDHVASFLACYFQAEQDIIFRLATKVSYLPMELGAERRRTVAESMHELMTTFNESMNLISARPPAEPVQKVGKKLELLAVLLKYFRDIERWLTPVLQDVDHKTIQKTYREYGKRLLSSGHWKHYHLLLIIHTIPEEYAKVWMNKSVTKIAYWNAKTHEKTFAISHTSTVNAMIAMMKEKEGANYNEMAKTAKTRNQAFTSSQQIITSSKNLKGAVKDNSKLRSKENQASQSMSFRRAFGGRSARHNRSMASLRSAA